MTTNPTPRAFQLLDQLQQELPDSPEIAELRARLEEHYHARLEALRAERDTLALSPAARRFRITPERINEARQLLDELGHVDLAARALGLSRAQTYRLLANAED